MNNYTRLTEKERLLIEMYVRENRGIREIGRLVGRCGKTISLEIQRNGGYLRYYAPQAHANRVISNREGYSKISENPQLESYIRSRLQERWAPEIIAGKWNLENQDLTISYEAIYQWVYNQAGDLYKLLPRQKKIRGLKPQRSKSKIPNRVSIHTRPNAINNRSELGHWECDLVFQQGNQSQNILSAIERKTRLVVLKKNQSKHSEIVIKALQDVQSNSEYPMKTMTFDNGNEFAMHEKLEIPTYFCDPAAPYQKGSIENINGIIRRYVDYRLDANNITQEMLDSVAEKLNNKPRKILGFLTPNEMMANLYKENFQSVTF